MSDHCWDMSEQTPVLISCSDSEYILVRATHMHRMSTGRTSSEYSTFGVQGKN